MKRHSLSLLAAIAVACSPIWMATTCTKQNTLDRLDSAIINATETFDAVIAWADRNPEYVAAHQNIAQQVAKIRAELDGVPQPTETLTRLHLLRDAYLEATASADEVETTLTQTRAILETARALMRSAP